ncbi:MAG: CapA family protein [Anaerolineales bacterium]|nr:MAG: CapA family protein [Anaerolineales bacterium]
MKRITFLFVILLVSSCSRVSESPPAELAVSTPARPQIAVERDTEAITLALGGDVMLGRLVNEAIRTQGPLYPWGNVLPLLQEADLALVNLECVIAETGEPFSPPRVFYFKADPQAVESLTLAGIDYVTLSNNHAMDFQAPALLETLRHLDEHGIAHAGAGRNAQEASQYALLEARGIKVGVVAFADHFQEYGATPLSPGPSFIPITLQEPSFNRVQQSIESARDAGADLVVFSIHWAPNMRRAPPRHFKEFARAVMDAGVDIFHGHSAHIFQGVEIYKGKPILYDTGDLIDDYYVDMAYKNDQQLLFLVIATRNGIDRLELVPVLTSNFQVNLAPEAEFDQIYERMHELAGAMGIQVKRTPDRLLIDLAE